MKRDKFFFGFLLGSFAPFIAFLLTKFDLRGIDLGNKNLSFYVLAALVNLLLVRYYYRNEWNNSARGIILITFMGALAVLFFREINLS